jgi:hypothetical protein
MIKVRVAAFNFESTVSTVPNEQPVVQAISRRVIPPFDNLMISFALSISILLMPVLL